MLQQRLCTFVLLVFSLMGLAVAQKPAISYCSSVNNGFSYQAKSDEFMTTGLCADTCRGSYAMAIVQGHDCWCSNYAPTNQVDTLECNSGCPGSSDEWCGNTDEGLFGYFQIALGTVLGTSGGPSSAAPSTSSISSSTNTPSPSRTSAPASASDTPSIVTSYITTGAGPPSTVLVTQTPVPSEDSLGQSATAGSKGGVSGGAIAGIVIGVIGGLAAIVAAVAFFCWRRRKQERSRESSFSASRIGGAGPSSTVPTTNSVPSRQVSQMSQAGLLGSKAPRINTTGLGGTYGSDARSPDGVNSAVDRRSVGTDQRLNPWAIYKADDQASSVSLHDERDYSRQLRVANPDE